ncbi:superkiller viralicidic activity 2-like 2 [Gracilaria domingensis]|nr:superkiller viralicidic activity 2-like 2 [Gracilaria domingensis]
MTTKRASEEGATANGVQKPVKRPRLQEDADKMKDVRADPTAVSKSSTAFLMPRSIGIRVDSSENAPSVVPEKLGESPPMLKTSCQHDVSLPGKSSEEYDISALKMPETPAKEYPFSLDSFQRESVKCLERNESVLVAAHTSAGKTVVAEYAIALALRDKQRVIYTSPIKALSNQKYRELEGEFQDVGLMTGDVTINKNASCLVMTTEILRSMLYRGSEVVREVSWVIFDEVHYMRDKERGVVWEETIILVPQNVRFVFLSATIPNAREFSEWIAHLKNQPCHTIYTDTRPVPLEHYLHPSGGKGLHRVVDAKGQFHMDAFEAAMRELESTKEKDKESSLGLRKDKRRKRKGDGPGKTDCFRVVKEIMDRHFEPVIVFSFSRKDCEAMAMQMAKLNFSSEDDRANIAQVFENAVASLNDEDQTLPQITAIFPLLENGIGIHHSGLLPIIKEVIELLFQEGLLKCLFATETFAMGLNMPAKTVVFTSIRKFDGSQFRQLAGGEYVQMSGRAGRRGLDKRGVAILMTDEKLEPATAKRIMSGSAEPLKSTFKLGYNMLINLLRAEEADPEYVIARSLAQFQADRALPDNEKKLKELEAERDSIPLGGWDIGVEEHEVRSYFKMRDVSEKLRKEVRDAIHKPSYVLPFLQAGRVVRMREAKSNMDFGWGAIVDCIRHATGVAKKPEEERYKLQVLVRCLAGSNKGGRARPYRIGPNAGSTRKQDGQKPEKEEWIVCGFSLKDIDGLSAIRVVKPEDLRPIENRATVGRSVSEALRRYPDNIPMLDPFSDLGIADENLAILLKKVEALEEAMIASPVAKSPRIKFLHRQWIKRQQKNEEIKAIKHQLKVAKGIILKDELKRMKRVLRRLGFINNEDVVEVKGRVACEINTANELVLTELLLGGSLNNMDPAVLVAVCSCFVLDEGKIDENLKLEKELQSAFESLKAVATRVGTVTKESNIPLDVDVFVESFNPNAMRIAYYWCKGQGFSAICELADLFEGSVIRCLRRLEELLRQLVAAVKSIGNTELEAKIEAGSKALKRGIPFHASLYV